jgi:hypothetical protein
MNPSLALPLSTSSPSSSSSLTPDATSLLQTILQNFTEKIIQGGKQVAEARTGEDEPQVHVQDLKQFVETTTGISPCGFAMDDLNSIRSMAATIIRDQNNNGIQNLRNDIIQKRISSILRLNKKLTNGKTSTSTIPNIPVIVPTTTPTPPITTTASSTITSSSSSKNRPPPPANAIATKKQKLSSSAPPKTTTTTTTSTSTTSPDVIDTSKYR